MQKVQSEVRGLVKYKEKFLVLEKSFGEEIYYDLPGRRVEKNEGPYDALIDYIQKNFSFRVRIVDPIGMWWYFPEEKVKAICNTFLAEPEEENFEVGILPESGIINYYWLSREELKLSENLLHESLRKILEKINFL